MLVLATVHRTHKPGAQFGHMSNKLVFVGNMFGVGASSQVMSNRKTATQMLAEACGKPFDEVLIDSSRTFYMSPDEAVTYGLIDKVRDGPLPGLGVTGSNWAVEVITLK